MKYMLIILCSLFAFSTQAQTPPPPDGPDSQLLLKMEVPCSSKGVAFLSQLVSKFNEQEFASGVVAIKPIQDANMIEVDLLMYVNPKTRTFTLFSLQKVGEYEVACVIAGGRDFTPFSGEYRENTN